MTSPLTSDVEPNLTCPICGRELDRMVVTAASELIGCEDCAQRRGVTAQVLSAAQWAAADAVRDALAAYGLTEYQARKTPQGPTQQPRAHVWEVRAGGRRFTLKRYHSWLATDAIRYEHSVLAHLDRRRLPVASPIPANDSALLVESGGARWALYPALEGRQVTMQDWMWRVPKAAEMLASLHLALEECQPAGAPFPAWDAWTLERLDAMIAHWPQLPELTPELLDATRERLASRYFGEMYEQLPRIIVHGDFGVSNLLWQGDGISAVLDFEKAHLDTPLFDFGWGVGTRWPPLLRAVVATYSRVRPLSAAERQAMPEALLVGTLLGIHTQLVSFGDTDEAARRTQDLFFLLRDSESLRKAVAAK